MANDKNSTQSKKESPSSKAKLLIGAGIVCVIVIILIAALSPKGSVANDNGTGGGEASSADSTHEPGTDADTDNGLDGSLTYYADIEIKDYGTITVRLDQNAAPATVANFVELSKSGFYDGLTFHRIINGFMMQGGDPLGTGFGGSDKNIYGEFASNGYNNTLSHTRGAISMARAAKNPNSASSQFFIVHKDSKHLDGDYAAFGYVTSGMDIVDAICESAKPIDANGSIAAEDQPVITSVTIRTE